MISLDLHLHPAQMQVFNDPRRFLVLAAGRRFGKSDLALKRAVTSALSPRNVRKKPVWIVGPVQPQVKAIYWRPLLDMVAPLIESSHINDGVVDLVNGVQIAIKGSDRPDTMRGVGLFDAILDEYASMKPSVWESIIRPTLSDVKGRALFIGTPDGRNHFYDLYQYALTANDPEWGAYHFTSKDNPFLPPEEVEAAQKSMSSSTFRQEYLASFETGGANQFKRDWFKYDDEEPKEGEWYVTMDLAGFADVALAENRRQRKLDYTSICVVKITPKGKWWVRDIYYGRWGIEETARRFVDAVESCKALNVGIEKGALFNAVSPHLVSLAAKRKIPLRVEALTHANESKEDRIIWALQGRFEHGHIVFRRAPWNSEAEDQLVHFPSRLVHDDIPDSLAMVEQLAKSHLYEQFADIDDEPYWRPMDSVIGF